MKYSEIWLTRTAGNHQKNSVVIVASPFRFSVFHFLAKLSKICKIFFSCEKKTMKLSLLNENVNRSSHRKSHLMALTVVYQFELWLKVQDMPSKLSLSRQGPWNLVWVKQVWELSAVKLTEFRGIGEVHKLSSSFISWSVSRVCRYPAGILTGVRGLRELSNWVFDTAFPRVSH